MSRSLRLALMLALPAVAAVVVYLPALHGGFLSDDYSELHMFYGASAHEVAARVAKTFVSGVGSPSNQYRPLTMASFALNALYAPADPAAWRWVNMALHAVNSALVALLAWQLARPSKHWAYAAAIAAGLAFAWFAPSAEAVAWIAARFDGMALAWMLVAATAFMASERWHDGYGVLSLVATALAFMSKESAAIGPALIGALAWAKRPDDEGFARGIAQAFITALPWLALAAAYFAFRTWIFGDPFRFYPDTSPGLALLSGHWLAALPASVEWWPLALPEVWPRRVYAITALLAAIAAVSASLVDRHERRVFAAIVLAALAGIALVFSHGEWSESGEGGRVLYPIVAIAVLALALPLRSERRRLRRVAWTVAIAFLGASLVLTRAAVERRAEAGAEMRLLLTALRDTAETLPSGSYAFVVVPDRIGAIPFARNAQGGVMLPPMHPRSLSPRLVVKLADELPRWPELLAKNIVGRLKSEPLEEVTANPERLGSAVARAVPDRWYCWSVARHALVELPLAFAPNFSDWNDVWNRALGEAQCR